MTKRLIIIPIVILLMLGLGIAWYYHQGQDSSLITAKPPVPVVQTAKVKQMTIPQTVTALGTLRAERQITVTPQLAGQVVKIAYDPGALVKEGQLLIQLDDSIYAAKLKSAEAALQLAKNELERYKVTQKQGAVSQQVLDQTRAQFLEAQAAVATNQTYLSQTKITAPFEGYVGAKNVSVGDYVQVGQALTTLTDRKNLLVQYSLAEQFSNRVKVGQVAEIHVAHHHKKAFQGHVVYVAPTVDPETHSFVVEASVPNPDNALSPGLFVRIQQTLGQTDHALVVPAQSVVPAISGSQVYVVKSGKVNLVNVKTGETYQNYTVIKHGLSAGDVVVTVGQQRLRDGIQVKEEK